MLNYTFFSLHFFSYWVPHDDNYTSS